LRRFVRHNPAVDDSDEKKRDARQQMLQLAISERLPIRVVNKDCHGVDILGRDSRAPVSRVNEDFTSAFPSGLQLESTGSVFELAKKAGVSVQGIGSHFPVDKSELFSDIFRGRLDVHFVSFDWSGDWLKVLDDLEMNSVQEFQFYHFLYIK